MEVNKRYFGTIASIIVLMIGIFLCIEYFLDLNRTQLIATLYTGAVAAYLSISTGITLNKGFESVERELQQINQKLDILIEEFRYRPSSCIEINTKSAEFRLDCSGSHRTKRTKSEE